MKKNKFATKIVCLYVVISFLGNMVFPAWLKASELGLPSPAQFVNLSSPHSFPVLKGLKFDPQDPLMMKFIIDNGNEQKVSQEEASNLVRYFLAGLTIPAENLWVNLSPYEKDRVAPDILTRTDLGKDLLSQDYLLKQISASLTYPESEIGRDFWSKTYQAILKIAKTTNLPVNTFNKIWIVPDKAVVYENENAAFVAEANLKVMLEEDYLLLKNNVANIQKEKKSMQEEMISEINKASSAVMREFILPKINEDVNKGRNFATLRQIYHSLILAGWFKKKFKESLYNYYIDKGKITGIDLEDKNVKEKIYNLYLEAFKQGLYNYIKTDEEPATRKQIKRRYYSGGFDMKEAVDASLVIPASKETIFEISENNRTPMTEIDVRLGSKPQEGKSSSPIHAEKLFLEAFLLASDKVAQGEIDSNSMKYLKGVLNEIRSGIISLKTWEEVKEKVEKEDPPAYKVLESVHNKITQASSPIKSSQVYSFGDGQTTAEGLFEDTLDKRKTILGGKGEGLHSMTRAKIPVPPGFTITTDASNYYSSHDKNWPEGLTEEINSNLARLEGVLGKKLGDSKKPLLVSVRSGAKFSMPGMMDTILNLGLNDATAVGFAQMTDNERLAWDSYRRLIQMFSDVVLGIEKKDFEKIIEFKKKELGVKEDVDLDVEALKDLVVKFKALVENKGKAFPQDTREQLTMAINAVFESWNNERAITYRKLEKISQDLGTAVNVQAMVFGNSGIHSATGVGFTRNPSTGAIEPFGEFLVNAQGEDVVAGIRTPQPVSQLRETMPEAYKQLMEITKGLERYYADMQDFEFTIENDKLYLLQTRSGKRTGVAAVKVAVDMVKEGRITEKEALMRVTPKQLNEVLFPMLDPLEKKKLISKEILATGLSAGPGAAAGRIVFSSEDAGEWAKKGEQVILWRKETSPDDIEGMEKAAAVGTSTGGMTSHAALVARGWGKVTMVGAGQVEVNEEKKEASVKNEQGEVIHILKEGDWITLNVVSGEKAQLILGTKKIVRPEAISGELEEFLSWAKQVSRLRVRANAETPRDAEKAFRFGAEGIGLSRTEHMFFGEERLPIMQEMILADTTEERQTALDKLLPMQREDFIGLFREMRGYPVTIRTLDPPLHEFLPKREELMLEIEKLRNANVDPGLIAPKEKLLKRINELHEFNPMMGMRGTRLGIMMPEITAMQARAIAEAAATVIKEGGNVVPEIMIPLVGKLEEFTHQKKIVVDTVTAVMKEQEINFEYKIGTMIEVPRGALTADKLASEAEFFSFGTNDLTQYGAGLSRDDIAKFMPHYLSLGIYPVDPFEVFDAEGIGELVRIAVEKGRGVKPDLKIGVCGEHGGDPESINFFHRAGLDYVSASPYRILGAWLAAAQVVLRTEQKQEASSPFARTPEDQKAPSLTGAQGESGDSFTKGGIDLEGIDVSTSPASNPVNMPFFFDPQNFDAAGFFKEGVTFRIIKLEVIKDLSIVLNTAPA